MARRGFSEQNFYAANPLPDVSDAEVLKRAGLTITEPKKMSPFVMSWLYAPGPDRERVKLEPGDHMILRKSEVPLFQAEFDAIGGVTYPTDATPDEKAKAELGGLRKAMEHYGRQGKPRLIAVRKAHGLTQEEMEDYRYDHWAYYYNQARADILKECIVEKQAEIAGLRSAVGADTEDLQETNYTE